MLLPQDKFAEKVWLESRYGVLVKDIVEATMKDCNLKYRRGVSYQDLVVAIGRGYKGTYGKSEKAREQIAEEIDKVLIRATWDF